MTRVLHFAIVSLSLVTLLASGAHAQTGGDYDLSWSTVDCGGTASILGGHFALAGTAGQPDTITLLGGDFVLEGGFWYGGIIATGVEDPPGTPTPLVFRLYEATPNPFNPRTEIAFDLSRPGKVELTVYDLHGRLVRTISNERLPAGHHSRSWNGRDEKGVRVASGVYFVHIDTGDHRAQQKVVLLK